MRRNGSESWGGMVACFCRHKMDNVKESPSYTPAELAAFSQEVRHPHSYNESSIDADTALQLAFLRSKREQVARTIPIYNFPVAHPDSPIYDRPNVKFMLLKPKHPLSKLL